MDILKLNKTIIGICACLLLLGCDDSKQKIAEATLCEQDSIMNYRNGNLRMSFTNRKKELDLEYVNIYHIRDGKILSELTHTELDKYNWIRLLEPPELHTNDSLKIVLNNDKTIYLSNFKNAPKYGGKYFLGCYFYRFTSDGVDDAFQGSSRIGIYY